MFINFIGVDGFILNLNAIALIQDVSENDDETKLHVVTVAGAEIDFEGDDAVAILERCEFLLQVTDNLTRQAQNAAANIVNNQV